jgi:hypothetical protein
MNGHPLRVDVIDGILVVRDDLVPGGTKARVLPALLDQLGAAGDVVYASPAYGYAQVALAHAAADTGRSATVFTAKRNVPHPRTVEAQRAGARVVMVPTGYLSNVRSKAAAYCEMTGATLLPFGLDIPEFRELLADEVRGLLPDGPAEAWTVAGSGTLTRALQLAWPDTAFHAVQVGRTPDVGHARLWVAPEKFEQDAQLRPPFPSCSNYDAKAWAFIRQHARPGALFWNVAE